MKTPAILFMLTTALVPTMAFSDHSPPAADISILKQKLAPYRTSIESGVLRARSLKLQLRGASTEITFNECKDLERKIENQYPLSPFHAVYKSGSSFSQFCDFNPQQPSDPDPAPSGMRYYLDPIATLNQFGVSASYLVRILKRGGSIYNHSEFEFLLDDQFRVIERISRAVDGRGRTIDWESNSTDRAGDAYSYVGTGDSPWELSTVRAFYSSGDGTLWGAWIKGPRRRDHGNEVIVTKIFGSRKKDWLSFAQIITHWMGQFFQYSPGDWIAGPRTYDLLNETSLADTGAEVCADGSSRTGGGYTAYKPSNNQDPWACSNVW